MVTFSSVEDPVVYGNPIQSLRAAYTAASPSFPPTQRVAGFAAPFVKSAIKAYLPGAVGPLINALPLDFQTGFIRSSGRAVASAVANSFASSASNALRSYSRSRSMPRYNRVLRRVRGRRPLSFRRARRFKSGLTYRANRATIATPYPRAEVKQKFENATLFADLTGVLHALNWVGKGAGASQREGNCVRSISLSLRMELTSSTLTNQAALNFRLILFKWLQGYYSPSVTAILEPAAGSPIRAPFVQANARNYRVLHDRIYNVRNNPIGNSGTFALVDKEVTIRKALSDIITFNADGETACDGTYYLLAVTDDAAGGTVNIIHSYRFIDL